LSLGPRLRLGAEPPAVVAPPFGVHLCLEASRLEAVDEVANAVSEGVRHTYLAA
jgi:hypothetical protein